MPSPVISYLHYLQEVSRKILLRAGYENVLYKKPARQNPFYFPYDNDRQAVHLPRYLLNLKQILQSDPNRGLFLGLGLFTGQVERGNKRVRKLAAPLCFCAVELSNDQEATEVTCDIRWESMTLNYDLIALVLGGEVEEETEDLPFNLPQMARQIPPHKLKVFTDIELELDQKIEDAGYQHDFLKGSKLEALMAKIKAELSEFAAVRISREPFEFRSLGDFVGAQDLFRQVAKYTFFPHRFLFVAPVPSSLLRTSRCES